MNVRMINAITTAAAIEMIQSFTSLPNDLLLPPILPALINQAFLSLIRAALPVNFLR